MSNITTATITGVSLVIAERNDLGLVCQTIAQEARPATLAEADTALAFYSLGRVGAWDLDDNGGVAATVRTVDNRFNGTVAARLDQAVGTTHDEFAVMFAHQAEDGDLIGDMDLDHADSHGQRGQDLGGPVHHRLPGVPARPGRAQALTSPGGGRAYGLGPFFVAKTVTFQWCVSPGQRGGVKWSHPSAFWYARIPARTARDRSPVGPATGSGPSRNTPIMAHMAESCWNFTSAATRSASCWLRQIQNESRPASTITARPQLTRTNQTRLGISQTSAVGLPSRSTNSRTSVTGQPPIPPPLAIQRRTRAPAPPAPSAARRVWPRYLVRRARVAEIPAPSWWPR
jgi:hypothetical protein